jgi:hypothetical protein
MSMLNSAVFTFTYQTEVVKLPFFKKHLKKLIKSIIPLERI